MGASVGGWVVEEGGGTAVGNFWVGLCARSVFSDRDPLWWEAGLGVLGMVL